MWIIGTTWNLTLRLRSWLFTSLLYIAKIITHRGLLICQNIYNYPTMSSYLPGVCYVSGCNFGDGCRFQCNCENGTDCDPITGECTAGYSCSDAKPNSTYGWGGPGCLTGLISRKGIVVRIVVW